jgi:hypothetical protein
MIDPGHYKAVVENPEIAVSAKRDTPCIHATVRITEEGPHCGLRLAWEGWLTDNAAKRTIQAMIFAGCTFPPAPGETEPNLEDFTGCGDNEVDVTVEVEEYTPEPSEANPNPRTTRRPRVGFINPLGGAGRATKKIDDDQKKVIAKSFGGLAAMVLAERAQGGGGGSDTSFDPKAIEAGGKPAPAAGGGKTASAPAVAAGKKKPGMY